MQIGGWENRPLAIAILVFCVVIVAWGLVRAFDGSNPYWVRHPRLHAVAAGLHKKSLAVFFGGVLISFATWALCVRAGVGYVSQPTPPKAHLDPPRVAVTSVAVFKFSENDLRVNLDFGNNGPRSVRNPTVHFAVSIAKGELTASAVDQIFSNLQKLSRPSSESGDLLEPGGTRRSTFPPNLNERLTITPTMIRQAQNNGWSLYLFFEIRYFDVTGDKPENLWHTEYCQYYDFNVPKQYRLRILPHLCDAHNGVSEIKK
ncbi:MAG: hypothetical protein JO208_01480 [Alphaproteobacteria bacterium]|nr:hypothetical protein [Alphaproteobacteria bacterium]